MIVTSFASGVDSNKDQEPMFGRRCRRGLLVNMGGGSFDA